MEKHNKNHHDNNHGELLSATGHIGGRLLIIILLNFATTLGQIIGGIAARSLSLISDSIHNFSDGLSFVVSYAAVRIARKDEDLKRTFGYKRATVLAALLNSSVLIVIALFLFKEAYERFLNPQPINSSLVIIVALVGLIANLIGVILLQDNSKGDMNLKSSYLHLLSDTLSSVAVVIGGILINIFGIYWLDPILTVVIALFVLVQGSRIVKKAVDILMQGIPEGIRVTEIIEELEGLDKVLNVHHVHIWCIDENNINFEAHVKTADMLLSQTNTIYYEIEKVLKKHGINHITIRFEADCAGEDCHTNSGDNKNEE